MALRFYIVALLLALAAVRGAAAVPPEHRMTRETYIWQTVQRLRAFKLGDPMEPIEIAELTGTEGIDQKTYSMLEIGKTGYLQFFDGSWLAFIIHSAHTIDAYGDLSLAIDETGALWVTHAHAGDTLPITVPSAELPKSRAEFLRTARSFFHPEQGFVPFPYADPPPLPPAVQACLDRGDFEGVLREMPEVRRDWEREQAALATLPDHAGVVGIVAGRPRPATATRSLERVGNPRLMLALPDAQGRYFDRVTTLQVIVSGMPLSPEQEDAVMAYQELASLRFCIDRMVPLSVPEDVDDIIRGVEIMADLHLKEVLVALIYDGTCPPLDLMPGPAFFQRLVSLPRLRRLDCPVPAEALPAVAALAGLRYVKLEGSTLDDAALLAFADTPGDELELNVEGTDVTQAGAEALVARRPSTSVYLGRELGSIKSPDLTAAEKERQREAELERTLQKQAAADSFEPPPDFNW